MSSNSSGYRVRRQLSFQDVPYRGKLFYVDIKVPSLKQKITKRIYDLGGQVESFLSKDLNLILVDEDEQKKTTVDLNKWQNVPLSRGQALLNASKDQKRDSNNNNDILHRALLLGVKTQTAKEFIQASAKFILQIKAQKKAQQKEKDFLQGMSPITWDKDKENCYTIKIEDHESLYRPLFKQFESSPKLSYNDTGSPFDVGVVLTRQNDGFQSKKISSRAPAKGGYCESCDHWYKSTLKEHLNSNKHSSFVSSVVNFKSLEKVSAGLPDLNHFMRKFDNEKESSVSIEDKENTCDKDDAAVPCRSNSAITNQKYDTQKCSSSNDGNKSSQKENRHKYVLGVRNSNDNSSCTNKSFICDINDNIPATTHSSNKYMTLDAVLQDILGDSDNSGHNGKTDSGKVGVKAQEEFGDKTNKSDHFINYKDCLTTGQLSWTNSLQKEPKNITGNFVADTLGKQFSVEANFSSSSCSFGDHGVNNVLNLLQSHDSDAGSTKHMSGRNSDAGSTKHMSGRNSDAGSTKHMSGRNSDAGSTKHMSGRNSDAGSTKHMSGRNSDAGSTKHMSGRNSDAGSTKHMSGRNSDAGSTKHMSGGKSDAGSTKHMSGRNSDAGNTKHMSGRNSDAESTKHMSGRNSDAGSTKHMSGKNSDAGISKHMSGRSSDAGSTKHISGRNSVETVLSEKSYNSKTSCMIRGSGTSQSHTVDTMWMTPATIGQFVKSTTRQDLESEQPGSVENCCDSNNKPNEIPFSMETTLTYHDTNSCDTLSLDKKSNTKSLITTNPDYSNITEESVSSEVPKVDTFKHEPADKGNNNCITPSKQVNEALRNEMMKHLASSGSTWSSIRNWLLPGGDIDKQIDQCDPELETTLVPDDGKQQANMDIVNVVNSQGTVNNICNENSTTDFSNNFVAAWIQNQRFEVPGESEHSNHGVTAEQIQQPGAAFKGCLSLETAGNTQNKDAGNKTTQSILANKMVTGDNESMDESVDCNTDINDDFSDCTSVSDCTLENFKLDSLQSINKVESNSTGQMETDVKKEHNSADEPHLNRNWDCRSQKSNLSCSMTDKGIKIKGLRGVTQNLDRLEPDGLEINKNSCHIPSDNLSKCDLPSVNSWQNTNISKELVNFDRADKVSLKSNTEHKSTFVQDVQRPISQESIPGNFQETKVKSDIFTGQSLYGISNTNDKVGPKTPLFQDTKHHQMVNSFSPQCPVSQVPHAQFCANMYSPISQTSQIASGYNTAPCMQHFINQTLQMAPSPLMGDSRYCSQPNVYLDQQQTGTNYSVNPGNPGFVHGDYFNTGMLPYEAQCAPYRSDFSSFSTEFNQSFNTSSCYMNSTTDYLAMSSPRYDSTGAQNTSQSFTQFTPNSAKMNSLHHQSYQVSPLVANCSKNINATDSTGKSFAMKTKGQKNGKRKRNNSQYSFLSSTSSFHASNSGQLSNCGFSSSVVDPAHSLQSDWYQSSSQSAVSSAGLSTIRQEDIADTSFDYNYSHNQPSVNTAQRRTKIPQKGNTGKIAASVHHQQYMESGVVNSSTSNSHGVVNSSTPNSHGVVNSSTPNSQSYLSPHSAMYPRDSQCVKNIQNYPPFSNCNISQVAPYSSPQNSSNNVSYQYPSQVSQQTSQFNPSQAYTAVNNFSTQSPILNSFDTYSQVKNEPHVATILTENVNQKEMLQHKPGPTSQGYVYNAVQTGEMRLRLSKIPFSQAQQNDLKSYWNVRKAGDCRLVFSNPLGKRKAEETHPSCDYSEVDGSSDYQHAKKRRCMVY